MSMMRCDGCGDRYIDTDADTECWLETKYGDKCYCEPCRDEMEAEQDKADSMCAKAEDHSATKGSEG